VIGYTVTVLLVLTVEAVVVVVGVAIVTLFTEVSIHDTITTSAYLHTSTTHVLQARVKSRTCQLSLPSLRGGQIEYLPVWITCVGWQETLCDPMWKVKLRSSEMGFL